MKCQQDCTVNRDEQARCASRLIARSSSRSSAIAEELAARQKLETGLLELFTSIKDGNGTNRERVPDADDLIPPFVEYAKSCLDNGILSSCDALFSSADT